MFVTIDSAWRRAAMLLVATLLASCASGPKINTDYSPEFNAAAIGSYYIVPRAQKAGEQRNSLLDQGPANISKDRSAEERTALADEYVGAIVDSIYGEKNNTRDRGAKGRLRRQWVLCAV